MPTKKELAAERDHWQTEAETYRRELANAVRQVRAYQREVERLTSAKRRPMNAFGRRLSWLNGHLWHTRK